MSGQNKTTKNHIMKCGFFSSCSSLGSMIFHVLYLMNSLITRVIATLVKILQNVSYCGQYKKNHFPSADASEVCFFMCFFK